MDALKGVRLKTLFLTGIVTCAIYTAAALFMPNAPVGRLGTAWLFALRLATGLPFALFLAWMFIRLERPPLVRWGTLAALAGCAAGLLFTLCGMLLQNDNGEGARLLTRAFSIAESVSGALYLAGVLALALPFLRHPEPPVYRTAITTVACALFAAALGIFGAGLGFLGRIAALLLAYVPFLALLVSLYINQLRMEREREMEYDA